MGVAQSSHAMHNIILACCLGLALATGTDYAKQFAEFKQQFGKEYATAEEELERFHIFKAKAIEVLEHNKQNLPYTKGINFFSDLTQVSALEFFLGKIAEEVDSFRVRKVLFVMLKYFYSLSFEDVESFQFFFSSGI